MHSIVLISSTVKEEIGCEDVSLHKLELGDDLLAKGRMSSTNIRIQIAVLPWRFEGGMWDCRFTLAIIAFLWNLGCAALSGHLC